jgi:adenylate kinase family enzyme
MKSKVNIIPKRILTNIGQAYQKKRRQQKPIEVTALIGKSGTGKSFRARLIADSRGIDTIIDDGLLIQNGKIIAGESAKHTKHYITAVKTAMFNKPEHRTEVIKALKEAKLTKILLLGTSERMIKRNCLTLELPDPHEIVKIEDIASEDEIAAAIHDRKTHGKHVIPLPVIEVKQAYPQLMAQAIKVLFGRALNKTSYDKTIVRPRFQLKGEVTISEAALTQMILHCMREKTPDLSIRKIKINREKQGYVIQVRITLPYGTEAAHTCTELHDYVIRQIENFTGISIASLSIHIESVDD